MIWGEGTGWGGRGLHFAERERRVGCGLWGSEAHPRPVYDNPLRRGSSAEGRLVEAERTVDAPNLEPTLLPEGQKSHSV